MIEEFTIRSMSVRLHTSDDRVFNPYPVSLLMANAIDVAGQDAILDVGTGSGILAITAAQLGAKRIVATDLEPRALEVARRNAALNGVGDQIEWRCGDLLKPVAHEQFDLIISNPPCMPCPQAARFPNPGFRLAVDAGEYGTRQIRELIENAHRVAPHGELLIPVAKWSDWRGVLDLLASCNYEIGIVSSGLVPYHIEASDDLLRAHVESLVHAGVADVVHRQGTAYAEVLICRAHLTHRRN